VGVFGVGERAGGVEVGREGLREGGVPGRAAEMAPARPSTRPRAPAEVSQPIATHAPLPQFSQPARARALAENVEQPRPPAIALATAPSHLARPSFGV